MGRGKPGICNVISKNALFSDLVDEAGKTGNLTVSVVLVKNALGAGLVNSGLGSYQSCCCSLFIAGLNSLVDFLDRSLDGRLDSLVGSGSLSACDDPLLGRFDVCHSTYLHVMYINV